MFEGWNVFNDKAFRFNFTTRQHLYLKHETHPEANHRLNIDYHLFFLGFLCALSD